MPSPIVDDSNKFVGNVANSYGNNVASSIVRFNTTETSVAIIDYSTTILPYEITAFTMDYYGQGVPYNNIPITLTLDSSQSLCTLELIGGRLKNDPKFSNDLVNNKRSFLNGRLSFPMTGVKSCVPGGYATLKLSALFPLPDEVLSAGISKYVASFSSISIRYRRCQRGEVFDLYSSTMSTCSTCIDSYSLADNVNGIMATSCLPCPKKALKCRGSVFLLAPGSWRSSDKTTFILDCLQLSACKGLSLTGDESCDVGYHGPLCGTCEEDYYMNDNHECIKCSMNYLSYLFWGSIFMAGGFLYLVYRRYIAIINNYLADGFILSVVGICISALQTVSLTAQSNGLLSSNFFSAARFLNLDFSKVSLSCFVRLSYYQSVKSLALSPFVLSFFSICVSIKYRMIENKSFIKTNRSLYLLGYVIKFTLFMLPIVANKLFLIFTCIDVDPFHEISDKGMPYLLVDLSLSCAADEYTSTKSFVYFMILVYVSVFSVMFLFLITKRNIIKNNHQIDRIVEMQRNVEINLRFGTSTQLLVAMEDFYAGYKNQYWYLLFLDLTLNIFITSVITILDDKNRVGISFIVSILQWFIVYRLNPFKTNEENKVFESAKFQTVVALFGSYVMINNSFDSFPLGYSIVDIAIPVTSMYMFALALYFMVVHARRRHLKVAAFVTQGEDEESNHINNPHEFLYKNAHFELVFDTREVNAYKFLTILFTLLVNRAHKTHLDAIGQSKSAPSSSSSSSSHVYVGMGSFEGESVAPIDISLVSPFHHNTLNTSVDLIYYKMDEQTGVSCLYQCVDPFEQYFAHRFHRSAVLIQRMFRGYIARHPRPPPTPPVKMADLLDCAVSSDGGSNNTFVSFDGFDNDNDRCDFLISSSVPIQLYYHTVSDSMLYVECVLIFFHVLTIVIYVYVILCINHIIYVSNYENRKLYKKIRQNNIFVPAGVDHNLFGALFVDDSSASGGNSNGQSSSSSEGLYEKLARKTAATQAERDKTQNIQPSMKKKKKPKNIRKAKKKVEEEEDDDDDDDDDDDSGGYYVDEDGKPCIPIEHSTLTKKKPKEEEEPITTNNTTTNASASSSNANNNTVIIGTANKPFAKEMTKEERRKWEKDKRLFMFEIEEEFFS